jgi:hypothetical protein
MKHNVMLTIASLLSIILVTFHLSEEIVRGMEPGGLNMLIAVAFMLVWLYGALVLAGRRSGYIIMLVGAIFGTGIPILHMSGAGLVGGKVAADPGGAFFWVWGNLTMGTISAFSLIVAVRCLWSPQWGGSQLFNKPNMKNPEA